jgi:hypothetical protein
VKDWCSELGPLMLNRKLGKANGNGPDRARVVFVATSTLQNLLIY